jgi:hypothetical protein
MNELLQCWNTTAGKHPTEKENDSHCKKRWRPLIQSLILGYRPMGVFCCAQYFRFTLWRCLRMTVEFRYYLYTCMKMCGRYYSVFVWFLKGCESDRASYYYIAALCVELRLCIVLPDKHRDKSVTIFPSWTANRNGFWYLICIFVHDILSTFACDNLFCEILGFRSLVEVFSLLRFSPRMLVGGYRLLYPW